MWLVWGWELFFIEATLFYGFVMDVMIAEAVDGCDELVLSILKKFQLKKDNFSSETSKCDLTQNGSAHNCAENEHEVLTLVNGCAKVNLPETRRKHSILLKTARLSTVLKMYIKYRLNGEKIAAVLISVDGCAKVNLSKNKKKTWDFDQNGSANNSAKI